MFIRKILQETLSYGIENKKGIFNSLKFPGLGILIISLFVKGNSEEMTLVSSIIIIVSTYLYIIFTVHCHRLFLGEEVPNDFVGNIKWNKRNTDFLFTMFALALSMLALTVPTFFITTTLFEHFDTNNTSNLLFISVFLLPVGYLFGRFSLVLPATATDKDNSWSTAWNISKGNGWNLCFLVSIFPMLTGFVLEHINPTSLILKFFSSILYLLVLIYEVSVLSNAYRTLNSKTKCNLKSSGRR